MGNKKRPTTSSASSSTATPSKSRRPTAPRCPFCTRAAPRRARSLTGGTLDQLFEDILATTGWPDELEALKRKYGTHRDVLEAQKLIARRPRTCCGTTSRTSCLTGSRPRWWPTAGWPRSATEGAARGPREALVAEAEALDSTASSMTRRWHSQPAQRSACPCGARGGTSTGCARIEFATIISGSHNDEPTFKRVDRRRPDRRAHRAVQEAARPMPTRRRADPSRS